MKIGIVSNLQEQKGLYRDAMILNSILTDHCVRLIDFRDGDTEKFDLIIQLEVCVPYFFNQAKIHWWIPNPEWCNDSQLCYSGKFEKVLCKTKEAFRLLSPYATKPNQVIYTGFMSEDHYDPNVQRKKLFFHAKRGSMVKGTPQVEEARKITNFPLVIADGFSDEELRLKQNQCLFHLQPSWTEGWSHTIWEGLSCGAIMASTDIPPMNEYEGVAYRIPLIGKDVLRLATIGKVDANGILGAVNWCEKLTDEQIGELSKKARNSYLEECENFKEAFLGLFTGYMGA